MVVVSNSRKKSFDRLSTWFISLKKLSTQRSTVSCKVMLVKSYYTSKLAITSLESRLWSSSTIAKKSLIVNSLVARHFTIGTKNFAILYVGVRVADKIGLQDGKPSVT